MRPSLMIGAAALALPLLTSCAPDLQALAADKNADCITLTTIWSTLKIDRNWGCSPAPTVPRQGR